MSHIPPTTGSASPTVPALGAFVQRLAARLRPDATGPTPSADALPQAPTTLTPAMLRSTLLEMGLTADDQNLELAGAFARLGLPLTRESLAEAHGALARAPGASALAFVLARAWSLPTTPAALKALTAATGSRDAAPTAGLPAELVSWLSLAPDAGVEPEVLAAHLFVMARGLGRSTENRVVGEAVRPSQGLGQIQDTRTILLRLAAGSADKAIRRGADALASHIEGQQLINQAARRGPDAAPFYLAVPLQFGAEAAPAEMRLWPWDEVQDADDLPPDTPRLRATVRIATARLGRIQAEIVGTVADTLTCNLGAEKPATARLLQRHAGALAASLAGLGGWKRSSVHCSTQTDWTPLWHGGDAIAGPRPCVDRRA